MKDTFYVDVIKGLTSDPKFLQSKYFYDDNGSRIFQEIMQMPEYYLTDSEFEILSMQSEQIIDSVDFKEPYKIIELGAGDGFKTFKLLEYLTSKKVDFTYVPIDISAEALKLLSEKLKVRLPNLKVDAKVGDYFTILENSKNGTEPNLLLFLGSNIGNYPENAAIDLLKLFAKNISKGDKMLIGIDLKKNPNIIHQAYSDASGITKKFNLNLLIRINREIGADFRIDDFDFYCHYNPLNGEVKSYLVSLKDQIVNFKNLDMVVNFKRNEIIWTELSKKYSTEEITDLANLSGFKVNENFLDCKNYFTDSLWEKR